MNTKDTPMDYKQFEVHTPIPQWVIDYNNVGHQSSAGRAVGILIKEIESLKLDLQKQKEEIEQLRAIIEKLLLSAGYALHESLIDEAKKLIYK